MFTYKYTYIFSLVSYRVNVHHNFLPSSLSRDVKPECGYWQSRGLTILCVIRFQSSPVSAASAQVERYISIHTECDVLICHPYWIALFHNPPNYRLISICLLMNEDVAGFCKYDSH